MPRKILKGNDGQTTTKSSSGGELTDLPSDASPQKKEGEGCNTTRQHHDPQPQPGTSGYSKPRQEPPTQGVNR